MEDLAVYAEVLFIFYNELGGEKMIVVLKENPDQMQMDNLLSWLKSMNTAWCWGLWETHL